MAAKDEKPDKRDKPQGPVEREHLLAEMTATFARSLDLDTLMQTVVRELGKLPDLRRVSIHVAPPEGEASAADGDAAG